MGSKVTRRELAAALASAPLAAQRPATPAKDSPEELLRAAQQSRRRNSELLAKFKVPMDTEPAFRFRP